MPAAPLTRRTTLVGLISAGGATTLAAGCSSSERSASRAASSPSATASLSTDEAIVSDLVGRLEGSTRLLARARRRYPGLPLAPLLALQRTHLSTLRGAVSAGRLPLPSATPVEVPATRAAALEQLRQQTTSLQLACLDAAGRAESGAFARLLASMGCALSQRLQVLGP